MALAAMIAVIGVVLLVGGFYEYSQTRTCGTTSGPHCDTSKHTHPRRAEALWVVGAIVLIGAGGVALTARRT
jgi:hypothetical protein